MNPARVRGHATLMAAVVWGLWLVNVSRGGPIDRAGNIKGTDFVQYYVGGSLARDSRLQEMYASGALESRARELFPGREDAVYLPMQSPLTSLAFAPLSVLSYPQAYAIWVFTILLLYACACWMIWRDCAALALHRYEAAVCALAFPGLFSTVLHGQTSVVALVAVTAALVALRRGFPYAAGLAVGCLAFKPHWLVSIGLIFLVAREWRVVAGAAAAVALQAVATFATVGPAVTFAYVQALESVRQNAALLEPEPGVSPLSLLTLLIPWPRAVFLVYAVIAVVSTAWAARVWRMSGRFEARASAIVLATLVISPHAFPYDLILLAPVLFVLANWLASTSPDPLTRVVSWASVAVFAAPLLAILPAPLRLVFSAGGTMVLLACMGRVAVYGTPVSGINVSAAPAAGDHCVNAIVAPTD